MVTRRVRRLAVLVGTGLTAAACTSSPAPSTSRSAVPAVDAAAATATGPSASASSTSAATGSPLLTATRRPTPPSDSTRMTKVGVIEGEISPKSVVANGHGAVIANNMMYHHTVTVYDAATRTLAATIPDAVDLAALGASDTSGVVRGAPVEGAFTRDGRYAYVSNYAMHGAGFGAEPTDACGPGSRYENSYVYRIDLSTKKIDQAIEVGVVPKYVAVTPDQKRVLVSNWCSYTLSVVDVATARTTATVPIGAYPRGIAVSPDSTTAYVTAMGTRDVYAVDLATGTKRRFASPGRRVRHVAISPDGRYLYAVGSGNNNGDGTTNVAKIETATGRVVATVVPGREPRTMALSADGRAAYVVNYDESTLAKIRTDTMTVVQKVPTGYHPIGATYEPTTGTVWVANYGGSIHVLDDTGTAPGATTGTSTEAAADGD